MLSFTPAAPAAQMGARRGARASMIVRAQKAEACSTTEMTSRRKLVAAAVLAMTACAVQPVAALAEEVSAAAPASTSGLPGTVYFGNGCFWGRQKDYVDVEKVLGRTTPKDISSVVGYAGGTKAGPDAKVCYYYSDPRTIYEKLGHAEVVQVILSSSNRPSEYRAFADTYFRQFRKTPFGMQRLDPQDAGPGYRNVVGLLGGVKSPFFKILQEANTNGMELREGKGNEFDGRSASEDDVFNVVWVVDSNALPFYRAERYHQFHNGIGKAFPEAYTRELKNGMAEAGRIDPTGCPELPFPPFSF